MRKNLNLLSWVALMICYFVFFLTAQTGRGESSDEEKTNLIWGGASNGLSTGIEREDEHIKQQVTQEIRILLGTKQTNPVAGYVLPPQRNLAKAELRDINGALIEPRPGKRLDGDLPAKIPRKDMPFSAEWPHHRALPKNVIGVAPNIPEVFWNFSMQDVYPIEKEGDYTMSVVVGLYRFTDGGDFAVRMDLPPVSIHIHLARSP